MSRKTAREDTFKLLFSMEVGNHSAQEALDSYFSMEGSKQLDFAINTNTEDDKLYVRETVLAVGEHLASIDETITRLSPKWDTSRLAKVSLSLLRLAVYEITISKKVPVSVVISEAVRLAKLYATEKDAYFINGLLAELIKETDNA